MAKILLLDIETSPNLAYVWRFWKENISPQQLVKHSQILSFAAKWLDKDYTIYIDTFQYGEKFLLQTLIALLDNADVVVAHYGKKFDIPRIKARALVHGLTPPSPFKMVDTKEVASKEFNFESNSLEALAKVLGCSPKLVNRKFPGFSLWLECLNGNKEAQEEMRVYNIQDVTTLEEIYLKMRPWVSHHPNIAILEEAEDILCPKCGSKDHQKRGFYFTNAGKYQRYQCNTCGGWHRSRYSELKNGKNVAANAR